MNEEQKAPGVFEEVVRQFRPTTVILHGKDSYSRFCERFAADLRRPKRLFDVLVQDAYLGTVKWSFGGSAEVFVPKQMRYFGRNGGGKRFAPLREALFKEE